MKTVTDDGEVITLETPYKTQEVAGPFWKTPYNHDRDAEAASVALNCKDPSRTQQQFAKDADINVILAKFLNTGQLPTTGEARYQDIEGDGTEDLLTNIVTAYQVEQAWNELPTAVRNILKDPKTFSDYVTHCLETGDLDPLRELGLAEPIAPPEAAQPPPEPPKTDS